MHEPYGQRARSIENSLAADNATLIRPTTPLSRLRLEHKLG